MDDITELYNLDHDVPKHEQSAAYAEQAIAGYLTATGPHGDDEETLTDLLVDLRHWAKAQKIDFAAAVETSDLHWSMETPDSEDDDETSEREWTVPDEAPTYKVVRFYRDDQGRREILETGLSLEDAQTICRSPETSSRTATDAEGVARTNALGPWFCGYEEE